MSDEVLDVLLPQLKTVVAELVEAVDGVVVVTARTRGGPAPCTGCGRSSDWVHSRYQRHVADEAVGGRPLRIDLTVRRLYCENPDCPKATFAEQVDGLTRRYQRRTPALQRIVDAVAVALVGSAGARLLGVLHHVLSWASVLNCLMRITVPDRPTPRVLGIDEFALRRGHRYATILTCAETGERIDVLPDRKKETVVAWLAGHPGVEVVCRDGAGGFAQAVTDADPTIVQVADRWHLWHGLAEAALKDVGAHSACRAKYGPPLREGKRAETTRERWRQVHALLDAGVGLPECSRRLNLALNTVKRYARHTEPDHPVKAPQYRPTLIDPFRDHLRRRRDQDPAVPTTHLLAEIRELGYSGSANLLVRHITQGRVEVDHARLSPRRATGLLLTHPDHLDEDRRTLRDQLAGACPEMTTLADLIGGFAHLLDPAPGNATALTGWITRVRAADLPFLHSYATGLERDRTAADAALTLPHHNGRTEGVNNKIKLLKRQMYGRAKHPLLRQRILLS
ncbi:ISL3 family transposase (plasmid) [Embleya sp. NBC_00888]|uniref:ISL3 family transposase n=1 Tax=Embleya sp. NBC_00888 TaxID=2975960 RepID=UPI002F90FD41|nr:ISL3 family transposase [Embleya sp. NBC_00888]